MGGYKSPLVMVALVPIIFSLLSVKQKVGVLQSLLHSLFCFRCCQKCHISVQFLARTSKDDCHSDESTLTLEEKKDFLGKLLAPKDSMKALWHQIMKLLPFQVRMVFIGSNMYFSHTLNVTFHFDLCFLFKVKSTETLLYHLFLSK